jgi:hypothetical protein
MLLVALLAVLLQLLTHNNQVSPKCQANLQVLHQHQSLSRSRFGSAHVFATLCYVETGVCVRYVERHPW